MDRFASGWTNKLLKRIVFFYVWKQRNQFVPLGPDNCAVSLYDTIAQEGNRYQEADAVQIDDMLLEAH